MRFPLFKTKRLQKQRLNERHTLRQSARSGMQPDTQMAAKTKWPKVGS